MTIKERRKVIIEDRGVGGRGEFSLCSGFLCVRRKE